jgi:putative membrane protein
LQSGLLSRHVRALDPARIQNVEIVQNLLQRAAGLVELRIETAGDAGVEGLLSAISVAEAERLKASIGRTGGSTVHEEVLDRSGLVEVLAYGVSAGRVGRAAVALGLAMEVLGQLSPVRAQRVVQEAGPTSILGLVLLAMALGYTLSVASAVLRFYRFRLVRTARGIAATSGLLTLRRVEIPFARVQSVRVEEPLFRRWMGYSSLHVDTAGSGAPGEGGAEAVIPMVPAEETAERLAGLLPESPAGLALRTAARNALHRGVIASSIRWALAGAVAALAFGSPWGLLATLIGPVTATVDWWTQRWAVSDGLVLVRRGWLARTSAYVAREKIQSVRLVQGPLLRGWGLARVAIRMAGGRLVLPDLDVADARALFGVLAGRGTAGG